jgi:hypothetical protein
MTASPDFDRFLESWLADGPSELSDRAMSRIAQAIDDSQRGPAWLPRRETMNRMIIAAGSVAAIALITVIGIGLVSGGAPFGPGAPPTASPPPASDGQLQPGTYTVHLEAVRNPLTVTFTVPEGWTFSGGNVLHTKRDGVNLGIQLDDFTSLNGDPCNWSGTADDIDAGTTVNDLVEAISEQTAFEVSEPADVTIAGYSGKRVDIIHPTEPFTGLNPGDAPGCDGGTYRIWNSVTHGPTGIYAQGPANRWRANILDVQGTRLVVVAGDFPQTAAQDRAEVDAILDSLVIEPGD